MNLRLLHVTRGITLKRDPEVSGEIYHVARGRMCAGSRSEMVGAIPLSLGVSSKPKPEFVGLSAFGAKQRFAEN